MVHDYTKSAIVDKGKKTEKPFTANEFMELAIDVRNTYKGRIFM